MAYAAHVEKTVPLPRARVYECLTDFGGIDRIAPDAVESVTMEGEGIGSVRTLQLKGAPGVVRERLETAFDGRLMSYSIVENAVLPVDHYHAVVTLTDAPGGGCTVGWGSHWVARGAPAAEVKAMLEGLYGNLIEGIVKLG